MKKLITSLFLIMSFSLALFSQEENTTAVEKHHQFGLNIRSLVRSLSNKDITNFGQETFTYRFINDKIALRVGIGGFYQKDMTEEDNNNFSNNTNTNRSTLIVRWGYEKHNKFSTRWRYYYGYDLKYNSLIQDNTLNAFSDVMQAKFKSYSANPLLGFQFQLKPHLLLQTEAQISFFYEEANYTTFSNDLDFIDISNIFGSNSKRKGVELVLPNILLLVIEF